MPYSPILVVHIYAGTLGLFSGTAAMSFRKGSPPPCPGRKGVRSIDADHGCRRGVPGNREASTKQHRRRNHNLLSDRNGVADCEAQRGRNEPYGIGLRC